MAMKRFLVSGLVILTLNVISSAQSWPSASSISSGVMGTAIANADKVPGKSALFLSGRVVVADGIPLPQPAAVESNCGGKIQTAGYTDAKGYFTLQLNTQGSAFGSEVAESFSLGSAVSLCDLQAGIPGFISEKLQLSTNGASPGGIIQVGDIVLHAATRAEGNMISATSAAAPGKAQKNFQKGCQAAQKANWNAAAAHFREAVRIYPRYAQAWLYLGKVQVQQGDLEAARQSFHEALSEDPKFVYAYTELAQLALRSQQ